MVIASTVWADIHTTFENAGAPSCKRQRRPKNNGQDATATATDPVVKDGLDHASETRATANESDLLDNLPQGKAIDSILKEFTSKFNKHLIAYVYLTQH